MNYNNLDSIIHDYECSIKWFKNCKSEWRGKSKTIERQLVTLNYLKELKALREKIDNSTTHITMADTHNDEFYMSEHYPSYSSYYDRQYDPELINRYRECLKDHKIKKVIFNGPATIIFWDDNTKTVVKEYASSEYDKEKGILYAALKRLATKKEYNDILRTIDKEECGKDDNNDNKGVGERPRYFKEVEE